MPPTPADFRQTAVIHGLRCCQMFMGVSVGDLREIAEFTTVCPLGKGDYLFHEGDPSPGFYVVQSGAINVHRVNAVGKEQVIHVFRAGESFAEATLATETGYPADARAIEPSQVLLIQKSGILGYLRRQPEVALWMLGSMSAHLRILVAQLEDLTLKDVETRLANWLLRHCPDPAGNRPIRLTLPMTKRVLASELGTVSETLSRTLAKFRDQGLIEGRSRVLTIASPARLSEVLRRNLGEPCPASAPAATRGTGAGAVKR